jgi:hypothetical protein
MMAATRALAREDVVQVLDLGHEGVELLLQLLALEPGQAREAHVHDRLRLRRREREARDQLALASSGSEAARMMRMTSSIASMAMRRPLDDVLALLGLLQQEARAPADDVLAVLDVVVDEPAQRERLRPAVGDRQVDDRERRLERRELEQLVQAPPAGPRPS